MNEKYNVYLVSDSTGETLDRIFLSLKSQFMNFEYEKKEFAFVRTEQQIDKIIKECTDIQNSIILYTIVETKLANWDLRDKKILSKVSPVESDTRYTLYFSFINLLTII